MVITSDVPVPGPVRTCVGCRTRATADELLRVVADSGVLIPDPARTAPGRGAHLHPTPECLAAAVRRRAFGRALRVPEPLDTGMLRTRLDPPHDPSMQDRHGTGASSS